MKDGFLRVACATNNVKVADCDYNSNEIIKLIFEAHEKGTSLIVFPELSITAYTCMDLFFQKSLLDSAEKSLLKIAKETSKLDIISIVGLPLKNNNCLYNCACVIQKGKILGFVPKMNIPNYSEFQELRFFDKGCNYKTIDFYGQSVPLGSNIVFSCKNFKEFKFSIEICEDLWVSNPPSNDLCQAGANIIANLSASNELISKAKYRKDLVKMQSAKLTSCYLYADAGPGESSTDLVFSAHNIIAENGIVLKESSKFKSGIIVEDIDLQKIESERVKTATSYGEKTAFEVEFSINKRDIPLKREIPKFPFVPSSSNKLSEHCDEILTIQAMGLAKRLKHTGLKSVVLGVSGGLDSTLALIVIKKAFDILNLDKENIRAVSMPCFGTTTRTKSNAQKLALAYKASFEEINIYESVKKHFEDIGHDDKIHDVTYENSQARERTQILMDLSNKYNALVIGTGDLSELALGFATYNGDHMSMYAVNSSIPKTLVRHLVEYEANHSNDNLKEILLDILNTPVSPELLPPSDNKISQKTEEIVGPYELHDFFLYYFIRFAFTPKKILRLALIAFKDVYDEETIKKWLTIFLKRFFSQQFKRSCLPDGPKVGSVSLSPRGDFRMPSDAEVNIWIKNLQSND